MLSLPDPILYLLFHDCGGHKLPKKRSPKNKTTYDSNKFLCLTSAPWLLNISWIPCCAFWSLVWFVVNRWINRLLGGTTKIAVSGKTIRKSVAGPVNNVVCPSVICWLSAVTLKCPVPIWPELSCCPVLCPPGSWVWVCGHLAPLFVWFKWVSAGSALPCFPGCKLTPPSLVWCVSGKHMTSGNGQGKGMKSKLSAQALGLKDKVLECLLIEYAWSLLKFLSSIPIHSHVQTCTHMCVICGLLVKTRRLWGMHLSFGGG